MITTYLPPFLDPIRYLIFGSPTPANWIGPFPLKYSFFHLILLRERFFDTFCFFVFHRDLFNTHTILGYYSKTILLTYASSVFFVVWIDSIGFFTGSCFYIHTLLADLKTEIVRINDVIKTSKQKKRKNKHEMIGLEEISVLHNEILM